MPLEITISHHTHEVTLYHMNREVVWNTKTNFYMIIYSVHHKDIWRLFSLLSITSKYSEKPKRKSDLIWSRQQIDEHWSQANKSYLYNDGDSPLGFL